MYHKFMNILLICIFLVASNGTAQEAVSSNGKFATINGLKLYYEESGELLTTKKMQINKMFINFIYIVFLFFNPAHQK